MNLYDILSLKFPDANFMKDIKLADYGKGAEIQEWNLDVQMPTADDLAQWEIDLDLDYRIKCAVEARLYPPIHAQLDMMYHDSVEGTTTWIDAIEAVKSAHPKPTN